VLTGVAAGLGLVLALVAMTAVRRLRRRLDALSQSYWELRYDYTRLRSQVARLDPDQQAAAADAPAPPAPSGPAVSFVPLSTIRKKDKPE
jgi:hypothetical protein